MAFNKLIIIPAFNESNNIHHTLTEIRRCADGFDLLVVDDGSSDDTRERAVEAGAEVISLPFNLGIGGAVQAGLMHAHRAGYEYAIRLDADGQHDPEDIHAILKSLQVDDADMVIGSRFIGKNREGYAPRWPRRLGIFYLSAIIFGLTGQRVLDTTSGFCGWNRKGIDLFAQMFPVDFPEPESLVIASRFGLSISEVPVVMRQRYSGKSSINFIRTFYYLFKVSLALFLMTLSRQEGDRHE